MARWNDEEENVTLLYRPEKPTRARRAMTGVAWLIVGIVCFCLLAWFLAGCLDDGITQADNEAYRVAHREVTK